MTMFWENASLGILATVIAGLSTLVEGQCKKSLVMEANRTEQYVLSPNYPSSYPRPISCTWVLRAQSNDDIIVITILHFSIDTSIFCYTDIFSIVDGSNGWQPEIYSNCGSIRTPRTIRTTQSSAILSFRGAANAVPADGFNISFYTETTGTPFEGKVSYGIMNYAFMAASVCIFIAFIVAVGFLIRAEVHRRRNEES